MTNQEYADSLLEHLLECEQVPIHDNACYIQGTVITNPAPVTPVPEPATAMTFAIGAVALWLLSRRKRANVRQMP